MRNNKSKIIDQIYSLASSNNSSEVNKLLTTNPLKIIDPNNYELEMSALKGYSSASHIESILKLLKNCEDKKFSARAMNFLYGCSIYLLARNGYKLKVDEILQNYNDVLLINAIEGYADNSEYHEEGIKLIFAHSNNSKIMLSLPFFL